MSPTNLLYFIGFAVTKEQVCEAADQVGALNFGKDFLKQEFRERCGNLMPSLNTIQAKHFKLAYLYSKDNIDDIKER